MAENDLVLKQRNELGFDLQVKLIDGRELQVSTNGKKKKESYSIDILSLKDKSKKTLSIAWKWLISSIGFFLVMLSYEPWQSDVPRVKKFRQNASIRFLTWMKS